MWNLVNIPSGIFIVDHACETMHNACKTGALIRKFAFRANKTMWWHMLSLIRAPIGYRVREQPKLNLNLSDKKFGLKP